MATVQKIKAEDINTGATELVTLEAAVEALRAWGAGLVDDLLREAWRWRRDEAATEGFCDPADQCEHHECRLARAVDRYAAAHPGVVAGWERGDE